MCFAITMSRCGRISLPRDRAEALEDAHLEIFIAAMLAVSLLLLAWVLVLLYGNRRTQSHADSKESERMRERLSAIEAGLTLNAQNAQIGFRDARQENVAQSRALREEVGALFENGLSAMTRSWTEQSRAQNDRLNAMAEQIYRQLGGIEQNAQQHQERMTRLLNERLQSLQSDNEQKLEQMRRTVGEKLDETLGSRLESSFKQVGEQLERVYKSLGEMQQLSSGVTELQRVLTNVKARGTWAELQLGNLLEQTLTNDQYAANVAVKKNSAQRVEYAVKLPGPEADGPPIWLPIDAKFPQEDYLRILDASERADAAALEAAEKALETRLFQEARTIRDKYICPPDTTDFAILYLPTEGLYAELLRRTGVVERLQRECRVTLAGPTTLTALLNSLSMGFRTLAVEKRSSEVWKLLGAIKSQYGSFSEQLAKAQKKIQEAGHFVDAAARRTDTINNKLKRVESLDAESGEAVFSAAEMQNGALDESAAEV